MKFRATLKDLTLVIIGNFLLACSVGFFILPYKVLSGGVAGIAVALEPLTNIAAQYWIYILILGLFVLGSLFLGRKFAVHTALSSFLYPIFLTYITSLNWNVGVHVEPLLASLYGGLLAGIGVGMVFRTGASTGGMDVPPLIINKYFGVPVSKMVLLFDALTVLLGFSVYGLEAVLIGLISVWACTYSLDKVLLFGGQEARSVMIISDSYREITQAIHDFLDRGTTLLEAEGGYTGDSRKIVLSVISKNQYPELVKVVSMIDKNAFIIVTDANEVKGNGFSFDYKV
jgi:uncharacterized membrane-anchored protein YitT (DUF2179 family)